MAGWFTPQTPEPGNMSAAFGVEFGPASAWRRIGFEARRKAKSHDGAAGQGARAGIALGIDGTGANSQWAAPLPIEQLTVSPSLSVRAGPRGPKL